MNISNISVNRHPVSTLLNPENNLVYEIPKYQREYTWGSREWEALFDDLVENEKVSCIVYTGAVIDTSVGDFTQLSRKAQQHRIPCLTSIDTASALADILASRYNESSTKLVDICQLDK